MAQLHEEGGSNLKCKYSVKFQKFYGKQQAEMYIGYDHKVRMKNDAFLESLSAAEKNQFLEEMKNIWTTNRPKYHQHYEKWYMILEGTKANGESRVKLFQDYDVFVKERDEEFQKGTWSQKGCWFHDLEDAKNYIQMARDEEGEHWQWPQTIPVIWNKGPLTTSDMETWGDFEEEEPLLS